MHLVSHPALQNEPSFQHRGHASRERGHEKFLYSSWSSTIDHWKGPATKQKRSKRQGCSYVNSPDNIRLSPQNPVSQCTIGRSEI